MLMFVCAAQSALEQSIFNSISESTPKATKEQLSSQRAIREQSESNHRAISSQSNTIGVIQSEPKILRLVLISLILLLKVKLDIFQKL